MARSYGRIPQNRKKPELEDVPTEEEVDTQQEAIVGAKQKNTKADLVLCLAAAVPVICAVAGLGPTAKAVISWGVAAAVAWAALS